MKFDDGATEILKRIGTSVGKLSPAARAQENAQARLVLHGLRTALDGMEDEPLAHVSYILANVLVSLMGLPLKDLVETLENSASGYSLVASHLMRYYDINDDPQVEGHGRGKGKGGDYEPGGYL